MQIFFYFEVGLERITKINSDFDIGILSDKKIPAIKLAKIKWILEESPWFIDIIDFQSVKKSFKDNAMKNIVML